MRATETKATGHRQRGVRCFTLGAHGAALQPHGLPRPMTLCAPTVMKGPEMSEEKPEYMACSKCGERKPFDSEHFYKDSQRKYGLRKQCRECRNKWRQSRERENRPCDYCGVNNVRGQIHRGRGFCSDRCRTLFWDHETANNLEAHAPRKDLVADLCSRLWTLKDMAEKLGCSGQEAKAWALRYSLTPPHKQTQAECISKAYGGQIEQMLGDMSYAAIAERLGLLRGQVKQATYHMGLSNEYCAKGKPWTKGDTEYLEKHYRTQTDAEIADVLDRTRESVTFKRRRKGLGKKDEQPVWRGDVWAKRHDIVWAYRDGRTIGALARCHGTSRGTIARVLAECGEETVLYETLTSATYRLRKQMHDGFYRSLSDTMSSQNSWEYYVPYTVEDLRAHLESQFEPGMSWSNYGRGGWHIDHIRPVSSFEFTNVNDADFQRCWALSNLQPLWEAENLSKSDAWDGQVMLALS